MSAESCAVVVTPLADLRARPDHRAELKSQRWHGEVVEVADERGHWLRVAGWDGYEGWVRSWSVAACARREARAWARAATACTWARTVLVRAEPSASAPIVACLPWGARVEPLGPAGRGWVPVRLADGRAGVVPALELGPRGTGLAPGARAARLARAVCGAPYAWGGTSSWGFDCSGLVQWAYALAGQALPRDARDQIEVTRPLEAAEAPRPGDLLFFGRRGLANHVAIVTAPPYFVHAYGEVEEATLGSQGPRARPELPAICLGLRRPAVGPAS